MKTLAFIPLAGCGGCEVQVLRAFVEYPELLEMYDIVYWPFVVEETEMPEKVDIAIVEGSVRTVENYEHLRKARLAADKLVVIGSCGSFGGINGQADYWPVETSMKAVYGDVDPQKGAPKMLPRLFSPADLVPVDYIITRCPPVLPAIRLVLKALYEGREIPIMRSTVCAQCPRKMEEIKELKFKPGLPGPEADPEKCFLSQGYLCLGSVTMIGCGAPCPRHGIPCFGCGGPSHDIALKRDEDIITALARKIATLAGMDPVEGAEVVEKMLIETYGRRRFYVFSMASEVIRRKPHPYAIEAVAETRLNPQLQEEMIEERRKTLGV